MCKDSVAEPMLFNQPDPVGCLEPPAQTSDAIQHGVAGLPDKLVFHILKRIGRYRWSNHGRFLWDLLSAERKKQRVVGLKDKINIQALDAGGKQSVVDRLVAREAQLGFKDLEARRCINELLRSGWI